MLSSPQSSTRALSVPPYPRFIPSGGIPPIGNASLNRSPIVRFAGLQGVLSNLNFCNSEHLYIVSWAMHVRVVYMDNGPRTP